MNDIKRFMDEKGRVKVWAAKREKKLELLNYISTKFENGRFYSEKEVNSLIEVWHTFGDYFLIRRELIDNWFLSRTRSGSRYWKEEKDISKDIIDIIEMNYDIGGVNSIFRISEGYGSKTYYVFSDKGEYIFKDIEHNSMNHPENEALIVSELKDAGIPVSELYPTRNGDYLLITGFRTCHLQKYIEGKIYN